MELRRLAGLLCLLILLEVCQGQVNLEFWHLEKVGHVTSRHSPGTHPVVNPFFHATYRDPSLREAALILWYVIHLIGIPPGLLCRITSG